MCVCVSACTLTRQPSACIYYVHFSFVTMVTMCICVSAGRLGGVAVSAMPGRSFGPSRGVFHMRRECLSMPQVQVGTTPSYARKTSRKLWHFVKFSLHTYRAINYDEKDPYLCNSCGFTKYAKFELTAEAKTCSAVDPIENEDDRKKVS